MSVLKKISLALTKNTTYTVGTLQAKAYTILTKRTVEVLKSYGVSPKEWALLGLLYELGPLHPKDAAQELGVEAAYITAMASTLKKINLLDEEKDKVDTRAKILCVTDQGREFIKKTEPLLRSGMRDLLKGVSPRDVLGYIMVLEHIIKNDKNLS